MAEELKIKKPRGRKSTADWDSIKLFCSYGNSYYEASKQFKVPYGTIKSMAIRRKWPIRKNIEEKVIEIEKNNDLANKIAESWAKRSIKHKESIHKISKHAISQISESPPEIKDWSDVERIDKMARRTYGLDVEADKTSISIELVNDRFDSYIPI